MFFRILLVTSALFLALASAALAQTPIDVGTTSSGRAVRGTPVVIARTPERGTEIIPIALDERGQPRALVNERRSMTVFPTFAIQGGYPLAASIRIGIVYATPMNPNSYFHETEARMCAFGICTLNYEGAIVSLDIGINGTRLSGGYTWHFTDEGWGTLIGGARVGITASIMGLWHNLAFNGPAAMGETYNPFGNFPTSEGSAYIGADVQFGGRVFLLPTTLTIGFYRRLTETQGPEWLMTLMGGVGF